MESVRSTTGLSTAALVAIACNAFIGVLLLLLCLIVYRACRVPSRLERLPASAPGEAEPQQINEHKYLLTS
uniref:Uncharacterized protein n=1 Tax=Nothobranchius furzeri TaxID=105023 RepID=A0A8C6NQF6_NOTFU